ncbi:MAG TPA: O-antigen ligase family protein [Chitinophagaceae bacterium]|nr:O-antigen ligase family protein [Chitinophagaceae bacterium]
MNLAFPMKEKTLFHIGSVLFLVIFSFALWSQQLLLIVMPFAILSLLIFIRDIRLPFYLLLFSIPISINLQEWIHFGLDFPDEPLMLVLTAVFVFFSLLNYKQIAFKTWIKHPLILLVILSFLWMIVAVIFSTDPALSSKYLVKRIWFLIPFLFFPILFFQEKENIVRGFKLMFIPLILIIVLVLYRYSALGFRFEDVHDPIQPFFQNHVMYGSMISCFVPLVVGALFLVRSLSAKWIILVVSIIIFLLGVYFSYSRAAWASVVFAFMVLVFVRFKVMHYAMLVFYAVVLMAVLWLSNNNQYLNYRPKFEKTIMHESIADHIMATLQGTDISSAERYYRWIASIRMSVDYPITGVGPNNFYENYKHYTIAAYKTWVSRNMERSTSHNYFLFMLTEQGYPALILYAILILAIFYYGQKLFHQQTNRFNRIVIMSSLCMIGALFVNNFFSELLETDKIGSLFLLGIAAIVAIDLNSKRKIEHESLV